MGMMHIMVKEDLYDRDFIEKYTTGFDKFIERLEEFPPERVEQITWVSKEKIIEAARIYATTKPAAMQWGVGIEQNINCVDADRALIYMVAMTGNLDVPGGNVVFGLPPGVTRPDFSLFNELPPEQNAKMLGKDKYKLGALINRITPHVVWNAIEAWTQWTWD